MGGLLPSVVSGPETMGMLAPRFGGTLGTSPAQGYGSLGRFTEGAAGGGSGLDIPSFQDYHLAQLARRAASRTGSNFAPFPEIALPNAQSAAPSAANPLGPVPPGMVFDPGIPGAMPGSGLGARFREPNRFAMSDQAAFGPNARRVPGPFGTYVWESSQPGVSWG